MSAEANHDAANGEVVVAGDETPAASPEVRVVKGNPSDEELAALVAVLTAAQSGPAPVGDTLPAELWGSPELLHRRFTAQSTYSYAASGRYSR